MKTRRNKKLIRKFFVWGAIPLLTLGCLLVTIHSNHASETKERKVNLALESKIESPRIPPIDEMAPPIIETASFGLG